MAVTQCQEQSAHVLHHLPVNPRTHLQLKKTQNLTQANALKSLFSESQNLGKGQRDEVRLEYLQYLLHFQDGRCKMQENYLL